jgi:hypothetical protein
MKIKYIKKYSTSIIFVKKKRRILFYESFSKQRYN